MSLELHNKVVHLHKVASGPSTPLLQPCNERNLRYITNINYKTSI